MKSSYLSWFHWFHSGYIHKMRTLQIQKIIWKKNCAQEYFIFQQQQIILIPLFPACCIVCLHILDKMYLRFAKNVKAYQPTELKFIRSQQILNKNKYQPARATDSLSYHNIQPFASHIIKVIIKNSCCYNFHFSQQEKNV